MNKIALVIFFFFFSFKAFSQKETWKKLGAAEKLWVFTHPFAAKKAHRLSKQTLHVVDSLKKVAYFTHTTESGSKADALRHCYWMSLLSAHIGPKRALRLGIAHEKKNKKDFEKGSLEEGFLPDSVAIEMDLKNNISGSKIGESCRKCAYSELLQRSIDELLSGSLYFIKQNKEGLFLSKEGQVIPKREWNGKWVNERVLVPTNWTINQNQE